MILPAQLLPTVKPLPTHPHTGLTALGFRRNGDPIWPVAGGAPDPADNEDGSEDGADEDAAGAGSGSEGGDVDEGGDKDGAGDEDKPLGPKGEKALAEMKATVKTVRGENRGWKTLAKELGVATPAELKALLDKGKDPAGGDGKSGDGVNDDKADSGEPKVDADRIRREAQAEAQQKADQRVIRAEVKAAAAGKLADPADALRYPEIFNINDLDLDDDGNVDAEELSDGIAALLKKKPYLAVAQGDGKRFKGTADGGARPPKPTRPQSLGEAVSRRLTPS